MHCLFLWQRDLSRTGSPKPAPCVWLVLERGIPPLWNACCTYALQYCAAVPNCHSKWQSGEVAAEQRKMWLVEEQAVGARKMTAARFLTSRLEGCTELNVADSEAGWEAGKFEMNVPEWVVTGTS